MMTGFERHGPRPTIVLGLEYSELDKIAIGCGRRFCAGMIGVRPAFDLVICGGEGPDRIAEQLAELDIEVHSGDVIDAKSTEQQLLTGFARRSDGDAFALVALSPATELALRDGEAVIRTLPMDCPDLRIVAAPTYRALHQRLIGDCHHLQIDVRHVN